MLLATFATGADARGPLVCKGSQNIKLKGQEINAAKDAITVKGACDITLIDCRVTAGRHAINVRGSGDIRLLRTTVQGGKTALRIEGSGTVYAKKSTIIGRIQKKGAGDFKDQGGNTLRGRPSAEASPKGKTRKGKIVCGTNQRLVISGRKINVSGTAVHVRDNCNLTLRDCELIGKIGVVVSDNGQVALRRCKVRGTQAALKLSGNAEVSAKKSEIQGAIRRSGNARFKNAGGNTIKR
ncbi:MAG: right-handed parallel beta-helix repeat-containing protein [Deltaproteobacteria bacterium]|nr:right-handed parallel beta-helix repeat-containing protein [Deltaproteobacteria bacterium]